MHAEQRTHRFASKRTGRRSSKERVASALLFHSEWLHRARARSRSRNNTAPEKVDPSSEQRPAEGDRVAAISRRHENTTVVRHALDITTNPPRDNPGRAFLSTQSTAKSDSNTGHQWNSAVPLQCCGNCLHQRLCNSCFAACRRQCLRNYWP
nr:uncharacterized protein LOC126545604 [Dermacentor andersoni]XP_054920777.1 uncharacterized protein LOC126518082 isoform X1 [Dermacentor andersoni]XP_054926929.1 uncharacterized protein LOC129385053 isoform X1 [Dermacentor andersoni]